MNRRLHDDYTTHVGGYPAPIRKRLIAPFQDVRSEQPTAVTVKAGTGIRMTNEIEAWKRLTTLQQLFINRKRRRRKMMEKKDEGEGE